MEWDVSDVTICFKYHWNLRASDSVKYASPDHEIRLNKFDYKLGKHIAFDFDLTDLSYNLMYKCVGET